MSTPGESSLPREGARCARGGHPSDKQGSATRAVLLGRPRSCPPAGRRKLEVGVEAIRRRFYRTKRITIATLQTMITEHRDLSSGYFDLVSTDECHRPIYGQWSVVLRHFDGIQLGLTATPCTAEADKLPDPEDGHFVGDTLRFFEFAREELLDGHGPGGARRTREAVYVGAPRPFVGLLRSREHR